MKTIKEETLTTTTLHTEEQVDEVSLEQLRAVLGGYAAQAEMSQATCGDYNVRL